MIYLRYEKWEIKQTLRISSTLQIVVQFQETLNSILKMLYSFSELKVEVHWKQEVWSFCHPDKKELR